MHDDNGTLLEGVLTGTTKIISGVPAGSRSAHTPCPDYDVAGLVNHLVGWMRRFEAALAGRQSTEDPATYVAGPDPAAEFATAARDAIDTWRSGDPDDPVVLMGPPQPRSFLYGLMIGEFLVHGWDLARATGQPVPFTEDQATTALDGLRGMLRPEYRGEGKAFGDEVPAAPDASAVDRLVAFAGRDPAWKP
jgi:uncharacterized protein (TIGR03086 family)